MSSTDEFFVADPDGKNIYTNRKHEYQAPEDVCQFDARFEAVIPGTDERIVFGFMCYQGDSKWQGTGVVQHDWDRFGPWKLKEN